MTDNKELKPFFSGGMGYFEPFNNVSVKFWASNKNGSAKNKYPYFETDDVENAKNQATKIFQSVNSYDKLIEDNKVLREALEGFVKKIDNHPSSAAEYHYREVLKAGKEALNNTKP